jgi:hypothetical protein
LSSDGSKIGVEIALAKTTVPPPGTKEPPMTKRTEKTGGNARGEEAAALAGPKGATIRRARIITGGRRRGN